LNIKPPGSKNSVENQPNIHRISIIESKERKKAVFEQRAIKKAYNSAKSVLV
jgi:hypothetical protein